MSGGPRMSKYLVVVSEGAVIFAKAHDHTVGRYTFLPPRCSRIGQAPRDGVAPGTGRLGLARRPRDSCIQYKTTKVPMAAWVYALPPHAVHEHGELHRMLQDACELTPEGAKGKYRHLAARRHPDAPRYTQEQW